MKDLRTPETHREYVEFIKNGGTSDGCNLCKEPPLKEFEYWKIISNRFPYDAVAKVHHTIVPKRHVKYKDLNENEKREYETLRWTYFEDEYDFEYNAAVRRQSIPDHFHMSWLVYHDPR